MTPEQLQHLRDLADAATPGPWERGDRYHVQGAHFCECGPQYGPLISEQRMDINGEMMLAHVHRSEDPWWDHGIVASTPNGPRYIVNDTSEYGTMRPADAEFIAACREAVPALLDLIDRLTGKDQQ